MSRKDVFGLHLLGAVAFTLLLGTTPAQGQFVSCAAQSEVPQIECEALVALYNATDGDNWTNNSGWLSSNSVSQWHGVTVSGGHVQELRLFENQLSGSIPSELAALSSLVILELDYNQLSGSIPPGLGNLSNLVILDLDNNQLSGSIPPELGALLNLESLDLFTNQLSGSIPPELGALSNLQGLYLGDNQLSGSIPPELSNLSNLHTLHLTTNQLSGSIPPELGNLSNLDRLYLHNNQLSGSIPLSFTNFPLTVFRFNDTNLCEPQDASFQAWLNGIDDLQRTGVPCDATSFSCAAQIEVPQVECEALVALYNATDGDNWTDNSGWLSSNSISQWHGVAVNGGHVQALDLYGNQLSGTIPVELKNLANLELLVLVDDQLSGSIPIELGNLANLQSLALGGNQLSGSIPTELGNLTNLQLLGLHSSQLSGPIPAELGNLSSLERLNLANNQLSGSIPIEFGNLTNLQELWLFDNQLNGSIPTEIGNLTTLQYLWLDSNQLSGSIPPSFTNLPLTSFYFNNTNLCEPQDASFQTWLNGIDNLQRTGVLCSVNTPPTVTITSPANGATFDEGQNITITATASDTDGTVAQVTFLRGSTVIGIDTSAPYQATFTNPPPGTYSLTARATDNDEASTTSAAITVMVQEETGDDPPTTPPTLQSPSDGASLASTTPTLQWSSVSNATSYDVRLDATEANVTTSNAMLQQTVSGTSFTVPAGTLQAGVTYFWSVRGRNGGGPGPFAAPFEFSVPVSPNFTITPITGSFGQVRVNTASPREYRIRNSGGGTLSGVISLSGDNAFSITSGGGEFSLTSGNEHSFVVAFAPETIEPFSATLSITHNGTNTASPFTLNLQGTGVEVEGNQPPTITITSPTEGATFNEGEDVNITATASDADGTVTQVVFSVNGNDIGTDTDGSDGFTATLSNPAPGTYTLVTEATDDDGATSTSTPVTVTVQEMADNQPPTVAITSPANGATFDEGQNITITATASDPDGTIAQVAFTVNDALLATDTNGNNGFSATLTNPPPGTYRLTARATDNDGASTTSAAITVSVMGQEGPPGPPSLVAPENNASDVTPTPTFSWSTVADADGYMLQVATSQNFSSGFALNREVNVSSYTLAESEALSTGTTYFWRVRSVSATAGQGPFSSTRTFTTHATLLPPWLVTPAPDAQNVALSPTLTWLQVSETERYDVQVAQDNDTDFAAPVFEAFDVSATAVVVEPTLEAGTTYRWHVRSKNTFGVSAYSDSRRFTTRQATVENQPPTVTITSPANGATFEEGQNITITATASDADGSVTQVAFFEGGNALGVAMNAPYEVTFASPSAGEYILTAVVTDDDGATATSASVVVTVEAKPNLAPVANADDTWTNQGTALSISVLDNDSDSDGSLDPATVAVADTPAHGFTTINPTTGVITYTPDEDFSGDDGFTYTVRDDDGAASNAATVTVFVYASAVTYSVNRSFGNAEVQGSYRLVALPGNTNRPLAETLSGSSGSNWRAFWDNGTNGDTDDYFVEYDGSDTFTFTPGHGFWLLSYSAWAPSGTATTVPMTDDFTYAIPLHDGWNIISNPFDQDIPWAQVQAYNNDLSEPLWRYNGSFSQTSTFTSAMSGEAFYFNNAGHTSLTLPYPAALAAFEARPATPTLSLHVDNEQGRLTTVQVGLAPDAADGQDQRDHLAPTDPFGGTHLRLVNPRFEQTRGRWAIEFKPEQPGGTVFDLTLQATPGEVFILHADDLGAFQGKAVLLLDRRTARTYDLHAQPIITLVPVEQESSFRLFIGDVEAVNAAVEAEQPEMLMLLGNYPNPFHTHTRIEYTLPSSLAGSTVQLEVYNLLGRHVRTLVNQPQEAGFYEVAWDGRDQTGQALASGVYVYRLSSDSFSQTKRLVLVK